MYRPLEEGLAIIKQLQRKRLKTASKLVHSFPLPAGTREE